MARRGGSPLKRREAVEIAKKLGAKIEEKTNHGLALVWFNGRVVTTFGIRRGTQSGHGHIPKQLFISERDALLLANCDISKEEYFEMIADKLF